MESWRSTTWSVQARPFTLAAHLLGLMSVLFVFIWTIYFRGGLDYNATNTQHIFNVTFSLYLCFVRHDIWRERGRERERDRVHERLRHLDHRPWEGVSGCLPPTTPSKVHPALMVLSLVFLASEGILAYRAIPGSKASKKTMHLVLNLMALILAIVGTCAVFKQHNLKGIENLYSLHSWLGLACLILFGLQWLIGFITFFYPGLAQSTKSALAPWHVFLGLFTYGLSIASTEVGFVEKVTILQHGGTIARFSLEAMFVNVLGLIVLLLAICVYIAIIIPMEGDYRIEHYDPINPID